MTQKPLPLQQINAFEAAARHLSFSRAAQDLNVQQPAISRQVAALEEGLGVALFLRTKPRLTLTADGERLARVVSQGFEAIRAELDEIQTGHGAGAIIVNAPIGFTSLFLLPRLAEFQALYPDVKVQVVTRDQSPDYDLAACDMVIVFADRPVPGLEGATVFHERMVALCHPDYLQERGPLSAEALAKERLLHMSGPAHKGDWARFFEGTGLEVARPAEHDRFLSYMVYLRAIQSGLGIGVGWRPMIDDYLASGALVLASERECRSTRGYFCNITARGSVRQETRLFLEWIGSGTCA